MTCGPIIDEMGAPNLPPDHERLRGHPLPVDTHAWSDPHSFLRAWKILLIILIACTGIQSFIFLGLITAGYVPRQIGLYSVGLNVLAMFSVALIILIKDRENKLAHQTTRSFTLLTHLLFAGIMLTWLIQIHFFGSVLTPLSILITMTALIASWLLGPLASWLYFGFGMAGWIAMIILEKNGVLAFFPAYIRNHEVFRQIFNDTSYIVFRLFVFVAVSAVIIQMMNQFQKNLRLRNQELSELSRKLEILATTDALTGLMNRRTVMGHLTREISRAVRQKKRLAVVMADLDDFKKINDEHGHAAGDQVLRQTSELLKSHLRPYDLLARIGGEEFLFVIADGMEEDTARLIERMRLALAEHEVRLPTGISLQVTASFGCAIQNPQNQKTIDELLRAADEALYASKKQGKNRLSFSKLE